MSDPYYNLTSLILSCDGANGSTTFTDSSPNSHTISSEGTPSLTTSVKKFGTASAELASAEALKTPTSSSFTFGTGDFTVEGWFYLPALGNVGFVDNRLNSPTTAFVLYDGNGGGVVTPYFFANGANRIVGTISLTATTWHHIALSRASGVTRLFVDGVQSGSNYTDSNNYDSSDFVIGNNFVYSSPAITIDDFRITKGIARYTTGFTPPVAALPTTGIEDADYNLTTLVLPFDGTDAATLTYDLSSDNNTVSFFGNAQIDTAQSKFGGSSLLLDGSGDYLGIGGASTFKYLHSDSEDFTIDMWIRGNALPASTKVLLDNGGTTTGLVGIGLFIDSANKARFVASNGTSGGAYELSLQGTTVLSTGTWYYIAITRDSGTFRLFVDGALEATATQSAASAGNAADDLNVGRYDNGNSLFWNGWIDDLRITQGVARYTAAFTPPTTPIGTSPVTGFSLSLEAGSFSLSGGALNFSLTSNLILEAGSYSLSGGDLDFNLQRIIQLEAGVFNLSGGRLGLSWSQESTVVFPKQTGDNPNLVHLVPGELGVNTATGELWTVTPEYVPVRVAGLYHGRDLPNNDPESAGAFWNDDGVLKVSNG